MDVKVDEVLEPRVDLVSAIELEQVGHALLGQVRDTVAVEWTAQGVQPLQDASNPQGPGPVAGADELGSVQPCAGADVELSWGTEESKKVLGEDGACLLEDRLAACVPGGADEAGLQERWAIEEAEDGGEDLVELERMGGGGEAPSIGGHGMDLEAQPKDGMAVNR